MLFMLVTLVVIVVALNVILNLRMKVNTTGEDSNRNAEPELPNEESADVEFAVGTDSPTYLVSYVMYAPSGSRNRVHQMCITNANE